MKSSASMLLMIVIGILVGQPVAAGEVPADRPNVVLFIADDLSWHDLGCYGNEVVRTPHVDQLAREGMRFTRAFTSSAIDVPSRSQLLTGRTPLGHGAYSDQSEVRDGVASLPALLRSLDYRVGLVGSLGVEPAEAFPLERVGQGELGAFMREAGNTPFCLVVALGETQEPWPDEPTYEAADVTVPPYLLDTPATRATLARYYTAISHMDREVGEVLTALRDAAPERAVVLFTADHGAAFPFAKWTLYDAGIRVPLIVRWPGTAKAGTETDAMVHLMDLLPTIITIAGGDVPFEVDGRSLLPVLKGDARRHRHVVYGIHTTRGMMHGSEAYPIRSVRNRNWKYIANLNHEAVFQNTLTAGNRADWESWLTAAESNANAARFVQRYVSRPIEELYDLRTDPFELNNLAANPAYKHVKDQFSIELSRWMTRQHDRGIQTEMKVPSAVEREAERAAEH